VFSQYREISHTKCLKEIVLARIANPKSKRASVEMLEEQFDVKIDLQAVYRMMGVIDEAKIEKIQNIAFQYTSQLF
jgi:hypothetical protein